MSQPVRLFALTAGCLAALAATAAAEDDRGRALAVVRKAAADEKADADALRGAVREALPLLKANVLVTESLSAALDGDADKLRAALRDAADTLAFEPKNEAALPKGFPAPTPVGEVRVQKYPAYRLARAEMKGGDRSAFMTLFLHIQKRDIAMTAPVEMTLADGKEKRKQTAMAFLYPDTDTGDAGKDGTVTVTDVPAGEAVSIGMRGDTSEARVADARARLEAWLADHGEYEAAGPARVMGYNSPFVPSSKRYFEVQLPVRPRKAD